MLDTTTSTYGLSTLLFLFLLALRGYSMKKIAKLIKLGGGGGGGGKEKPHHFEKGQRPKSGH